MKNLIGVALLIVTQFIQVAAEQPDRPPLTVTYVGNEGFLIESEGKKFLIDALFGGFEADWCVVPSDGIVSLMTAAHPPFDDIDVIAVTHAHADHINSKISVAHMMRDTQAIMICPPQAAERLAAIEGYEAFEDRLRIVPAPGDSAVIFDIAGIEVAVLPSRHGVYMETDPETGETVDRHRNVQHLEYLVNIDGWCIYHSGDSPQNDPERSQRFGLGEKPVDIAFLQWWGEWSELSRRQKWAREILRPDRIVFMHLRPGRQVPDQPPEQKPVAREIIRPQQVMERWTFE